MAKYVYIKGDARVVKDNLDRYPDYPDDPETVETDWWELHGFDKLALVELADEFSQWLNSEFEYLKELVSEGWAYFVYEDHQLYVITRYRLKNFLTEREKQDLIAFTQGQWSDGIGESFEQCPFSKNGVDYHISMWHPDQKVTIYFDDTDAY